MQEMWGYSFNPWVGKITWRRKWQPAPAFLPRESCGQRSLVGYSPWGHKESDMAEHAHGMGGHKGTWFLEGIPREAFSCLCSFFYSVC